MVEYVVLLECGRWCQFSLKRSHFAVNDIFHLVSPFDLIRSNRNNMFSFVSQYRFLFLSFRFCTEHLSLCTFQSARYKKKIPVFLRVHIAVQCVSFNWSNVFIHFIFQIYIPLVLFKYFYFNKKNERELNWNHFFFSLQAKWFNSIKM